MSLGRFLLIIEYGGENAESDRRRKKGVEENTI